MKITITDITYQADEQLIKLTLLMDDKQNHFELQIKQHQGIEYIPYGDELLSILMLNTEGLMKFNQVIKKIKTGKLVSLPLELG